MASPSQLIQLAKSLPTPLQRFFARYPPAAIVPEGSPKTPSQESRPDPFRFYKHPVTGKWQDPVYSQRRQAELVKMAREHGVEDLLPDTRKGTEYRLAHRVEHGLRVKGTGVGQKVKGHIHERHMIAKMEQRRKAMLEMPSLIKRWKRASYGTHIISVHHANCHDSPRPTSMASSTDFSAASGTATHYQVLNLTATLLDTQQDPTPLIKRAYHRALLRNHPDKVAASNPSDFFTVDQITTALNVLSSPSSRAAYDAALRVSRPAGAASRDAAFQTGVENVDLDDLAFDEDDECWYRPCRCGNERSYVFREADLEEVSDEGELVVACLDCSLWLRVHFAVMDVEDDETPPSNDITKKS
ncbi:Diphthamide biosynthesis protein 4 [Fusarium sp. Ph1]|nr:Diphthamide biosynthesis protein 4 [Fusarium sp. Ph1]